jgi:VanZ family protein
VASWRESFSPHSGGTVPDLHRSSLTALRLWARAYHAAVSASALTTSRSALLAWLPILAWAAMIFAFSSVPGLSSGLGTWDLVLRKLAHLTEYAVLGALLVRGTHRPWLALALGALYAVSDEVHQHFVNGRHGAPLDVAIDTVGVAAGILAWGRLAVWWEARRARSRAPRPAP